MRIMESQSHIFSQFSDAPDMEVVWFGTWLVRKKYLDAYGAGIWTCLRHVPGLRKRMIVALWNAAQFYPSTHKTIPFPYDALQLSSDGFRARGFKVAEHTTVKTVYRDSRYGHNTEYELSVRENILKSSDLKIPKILSSRFHKDYVQFDEEFVSGRIFSHWRDTYRFWDEIGAPLLKVCETVGITQKPLTEVLEEKFTTLIAQADGGHPQVDAAKALLEKNPVIAASFSHGDTVSSNMIVGKDGFYLIDWERAGERYAGYDFARLSLKHPWNPHYKKAAQTVFDKHQQGRFTLGDANTIRLAVAEIRKAAKR